MIRGLLPSFKEGNAQLWRTNGEGGTAKIRWPEGWRRQAKLHRVKSFVNGRVNMVGSSKKATGGAATGRGRLTVNWQQSKNEIRNFHIKSVLGFIVEELGEMRGSANDGDLRLIDHLSKVTTQFIKALMDRGKDTFFNPKNDAARLIEIVRKYLWLKNRIG